MSSKEITVALVGNPNTGKSTLFNALTGLRQKVGNYPGVTVARKSGRCDCGDGLKVELVDLPGLYSLAAASPDEQVVTDVLLGSLEGSQQPDAIVVVLDATNLLRNLFLASQLAELNLPLALVLNQADIAHEQGLKIDTQLLSQRLGGVPVVLTSAWKGEGISLVRRAIAEVLNKKSKMTRLTWPGQVESALGTIVQAIQSDTSKAPSSADAQRILFSSNAHTSNRLGWSNVQRDSIVRQARDQVRAAGLRVHVSGASACARVVRRLVQAIPCCSRCGRRAAPLRPTASALSGGAGCGKSRV
jgi:ferrous iron transport protein B